MWVEGGVGKGPYIVERNKQVEVMENCKSSVFLAYWPNVFYYVHQVERMSTSSNCNDSCWQIWTENPSRFWVFESVCSVSPSKKMENFLGCPLFPQWFFWLSRPGQMEHLTTVSHISKLDQQVGIKELDYLNITFPGFARKEFAKAFTFSYHTCSNFLSIIITIIIII